MNWTEYAAGLRRGMPVAVGYFSVSFGFGAMAVSQGLRALDATLISLTNLTSAGQFAGLTVIIESGTVLEMILTQLIINSRYFLMSLALSQKVGGRIRPLQRALVSFFVTDEIFALAIARKEPLTTPYMLGLGSLPTLGWTGGTLCGALVSSLLPISVRTALGVALYGMFIAVVVPQAKSDRTLLAVSLISIAFSSAFQWIPLLSSVSAGLSIVICTVLGAAICALLFPIDQAADAGEEVSK